MAPSSATAVGDTTISDALVAKFRALLPDKSPSVLSEIFFEMTNSVYKGKAKEGDKINETAKTPWGGVAAKFRSLNLIEFKIAMYRFKSAGLTFEEIRRIFLWLDTSGNGRVECDEFVVGIRGVLALIRQRIVVYLFRKLDRNSSGFVEESELALHLRRANIPDIVEGVITPQAKAKEFIQLMGTPMNGTTTPEGNISVEQMVDFYLTRSLETEMNDEEFKAMVLVDWGMDASEGMAMPALIAKEISREFGATPSIGKEISKESATNAQHVTPVMPATPASSNVNASPRKIGVNTATATSKAPPALNVDAEQYGEQYKQQYQNLISPARKTSTVAANAPNEQVEAQKKAPVARGSSFRAPTIAKSFRDIPASIVQAVSAAVSQQGGVTGGAAGGTASGAGSYRQAPGNSDAMITNNLNMLVVSLQTKITDMQQTIDSQSQIISTQQQMLGQLQFVIQTQQQQK